MLSGLKNFAKKLFGTPEGGISLMGLLPVIAGAVIGGVAMGVPGILMGVGLGLGGAVLKSIFMPDETQDLPNGQEPNSDHSRAFEQAAGHQNPNHNLPSQGHDSHRGR